MIDVMRRLVLLSVALLSVLPGPALGAPSGETPPEIWQPPAGITFQWQLQGEVDTSVAADVYDIDGFDSPQSLIDELHDQGRKVVCYISAGSYENWRPDESDFPSEVLGKALDGWAGERWLDIRRVDLLRPIMNKRMDMCADKGFDGIEFDNVDGYSNNTGFDLDRADQKRYIRYLVNAAHKRGLAAGLKNVPEMAANLEPNWDFAVNEQCFQYDECDGYSAFINAGKAVFHVEYETHVSEFCPEANDMGFTSMRKRYSLKAWRQACWEQ